MKKNYRYDTRSKLKFWMKDGKVVDIHQPYSRPSEQVRKAFNKALSNPEVPFYSNFLYSVAKNFKITKLENEAPDALLSRIKNTYARELGRRFPYEASCGSLFTREVMWDIEKLAKKVFPFINNPPNVLLEKLNSVQNYDRKLVKPNQVELKLQTILQHLFPDEFNLNVLKARRIGRKIPDFIHKSLPILVEMFGDYWHGPLMTGRSNYEEAKLRIDYFSHFDFVTVVIWEFEVENVDEIKKRILLAKKYI
jgi:hypothetical protein